MKTRFIIVDNHAYHIQTARSLLVGCGYAEEDVWPDDDKQSEEWGEVFAELMSLQKRGWDPKTDCIVLLLDLALDQRDQTFAEGIAQIKNYAETVLKPYVSVVLTQWSGPAEQQLRTVVDGVFDRTHALGETDQASSMLRLTIDQAVAKWGRRTGRPKPSSPRSAIRLLDSPGMRRAEASLGSELLVQLAERVARPSQDVELSVETGGYSGAFIVKVEWTSDGGRKRVICKVSDDEDALLLEVAAYRRALEFYGNYAGLIPPLLDTTIHPLGTRHDAFYVVQCKAPGRTLENVLLEHVAGGDLGQAKEVLTLLLGRLQRMAEASIANGCSIGPLPIDFRLKEIDVSRFEASLPSLSGIRRRCTNMGYLSPDVVSDGDVEEFTVRVVRSWDELATARFGSTRQYPQHGDLNARNIVLAGDSTQLIDFARFGPWPAGYDFVRLELQLALRLIDSGSLRDAFPDRLISWLKLSSSSDTRVEAAESEGSAVEPGQDAAALLFGWFSRELRRTRDELLRRSELAGGVDVFKVVLLERIFDAIKVCSYQDATWFKRLWFLIIAIEDARELGLVSRT